MRADASGWVPPVNDVRPQFTHRPTCSKKIIARVFRGSQINCYQWLTIVGYNTRPGGLSATSVTAEGRATFYMLLEYPIPGRRFRNSHRDVRRLVLASTIGLSDNSIIEIHKSYTSPFNRLYESPIDSLSTQVAGRPPPYRSAMSGSISSGYSWMAFCCGARSC